MDSDGFVIIAAIIPGLTTLQDLSDIRGCAMSSSRRVASSVPHSFFRRSVIIAALVAVSLLPVQSKEAPLTAIELYDSPSGPAYVQITDVLINGKIEMRGCASTPSIDKSSYAKLQKVNLAVGDSLDYGTDGRLTLAKNATSTCVVPGNLKLEKNGPMSASDLAAKAVLQARVIAPVAGASDIVPPLSRVSNSCSSQRPT